MYESKNFQNIRITGEHQSIDHAFRLFMDILKRPHVGQFVERIELIQTPKHSGDYPARKYERELSPEEMALLRSAARDAGSLGAKQERMVHMLMQKTPNKDYPD
ncbi:hypothetical protein PENANT_c062G06258 [Penicillium antarcticum]|uniref:Uncharacterized protein n=2 Tax=Penicillium antarcticum TaxID=416450 RepID=A0A1V6PQ26_9EURO|nr:hypothetical protein PENANT_c062G06258 [Penicillium antarcticum]